MKFTPWLPLLLAVPVLLLGESLVRRVKVLRRFNIPAPVVGGLLVSLALLLVSVAGFQAPACETRISARWWTWLVTIEPDWASSPAKPANTPFLVAFFTCLGLNASWLLVRRSSLHILVFLAAASVLAVFQNLLGAGLAVALGQSPLLGIVCGSVTMTGGHGTALGFAPELEKAGLLGAGSLGMAAATFGLVAGGLLGGPLGGGLITRFKLLSTARPDIHLEAGRTGESGIVSDLKALVSGGTRTLAHILLVLACVKAGAWMSALIQLTGIAFPVYMGAMVVGVALRNVLDLSGHKRIQTETIDLIASASLGIFLSSAMMTLNLMELAGAALPMLCILSMQVLMMAAFAWFVTFRLAGKDFDAAVIAGGHCGFGMGATPNAVANMKALVQRFGPAPRAFLVVPIVGSFLIDLVNATNITVFLNLFRSGGV